MPRRRTGHSKTLATAEKPSAVACHVCGAPIKSGEPVGWTWARQRIHESCMARWAIGSRRPFSSWVAEPVRQIVASHGGAMCVGCLALELALSLDEASALAATSASCAGLGLVAARCSACGRAADSVSVVADSVDGPEEDDRPQAAVRDTLSYPRQHDRTVTRDNGGRPLARRRQ